MGESDNSGEWGPQPPQGGWSGFPPPASWESQQAPASRGRLRPLTLADVLDGMFRMFLAHWRTYVLALGLVLLPLNFVLAVLAGLAGVSAGVLDQLMNPATAQAAIQNGPELAALMTFFAIAALSSLFVTPFVTGVACRIAADAFDGQDPQPGPVLKATLPRYWSLVGLTVAFFAMSIAVLALPVGLIAAGVGTDTDALIGFGALLAIVAVPVTIWLLIRYRLGYPAIVVEHVGPLVALRRSAQLVKGRWWRVFGTLVLALIVSSIVAQIASFPFALPGNIFGAAVGVIFVTIGSVIATVITTPLSANALTLLYFDGRIRSEGYDLEMMIRGVGDPTSLPPPTGPAFG